MYLEGLFDKEISILNYATNVVKDKVLFYDGNSYNRKIWRYVCDLQNLVDNSGKSDPPPDFYSKDDSIMFDVAKIMDSEFMTDDKKHPKLINPVKARERAIKNDIRNKFDFLNSKNTIIIKSEKNDEEYDIEHTMVNYYNHFNRVVNEHISKIHLWQELCPNIKNKGLLLFDEVESYINGKFVKNDLGVYVAICKQEVVMHEPWKDIRFMQHIYNKGLDFVVWVFYCKYNPYLPDNMQNYPRVVVIDTRYNMDNNHFVDYEKYNFSSF